MDYQRTKKGHKLTEYNRTVQKMTPQERYQAGMGKYHPSMLKEMQSLARFGLTNAEIAEFYGLHIQTFERYIKEIPELYAAIEEGKMIDSMKVVDSLHKQALGYKVKEYEIAEHMDRNGNIIKLKKKTIKHIQPNATAAIYLLKTRHGDKWMDVVRSEQTRNINVNVKNVNFSDMSDEELKTLKQLGVKRIPAEFTRPKETELQNAIIVQDVHGN